MAKLPDSQVIKDLAELLNTTGLTEIEIESGGMRIKVARSGGQTTAYVPAETTKAILSFLSAALQPHHISCNVVKFMV